MSNELYTFYSFQILIKGLYKHLILLKRPFTFDGFIEFGHQDANGVVLEPIARISISTVAGSSDRALSLYNSETIEDSESTCPRQMLRFNPPPSVKYCDKETFREISMLSQYAANIRFTNVSMRDWKIKIQYFIIFIVDAAMVSTLGTSF